MTELADHVRFGNGPPLLLIHGFTATWRAWGPTLGTLGQHFTVLAPTLPGHHGGPQAGGPLDIEALTAFLARVLEAEEIKTTHVAGFSLGGWLAFELAKRGRARSISAIAPAGAPENFDPAEVRRISWLFRRSRRGAQLAAPWLGRLVRSKGFRRRALSEMMVHGDRLTAREAEELIAASGATPSFRQLSEDLPHMSPIDGLDQVDVPVQLLWGERDKVLPLRSGEFFHRQLAEARFRVLAQAGHVPFWDAPQIGRMLTEHALAAEEQRRPVGAGAAIA